MDIYDQLGEFVNRKIQYKKDIKILVLNDRDEPIKEINQLELEAIFANPIDYGIASYEYITNRFGYYCPTVKFKYYNNFRR